MSDQITTEIDGHVLRVKINRPEKKNALSAAMYLQIVDAFEQAAKTKTIRVLTLEGSEDVFSAGNDMDTFFDPQKSIEDTPSYKLMKAAIEFPKPALAAVCGPAVGIGVTLLLHFDFIVASEAAYFYTPFTKLGAVPEAASSAVMPKRFGNQMAAEMLMFGDKIPARRAYDIGLVNRLVLDKEATETMMEAAHRIAALPPESVQQTKALMRGDNAALLAVARDEMKIFGARTKSPEMHEAVAAFLQKRKPDFAQFD